MNILTDRRCLGLAVLLASVAALVAVVMLSAGFHPLLAWLPPFILAAAAWTFVATAIEGGKSYMPSTEQMQLMPEPDALKISSRRFNRLRWVFEPETETEIRLVTNKSLVDLFRAIMVPVVLYALAFIALPNAGGLTRPLVWVMLVMAVPALVFMVIQLWKWQSLYLIVTNVYVRLVEAPWKWLFPLGYEKVLSELPILKIETSRMSVKRLDNLFGCGTVMLDSPGTGDEIFNEIKWVSDPGRVLELINLGKVPNRQNRAEQVQTAKPRWFDRKSNGPVTQPIPNEADDNPPGA